MKTHKGRVSNYLAGKEEIYSSHLDGSFYGGFTTMKLNKLTKKVEGNDLLFDVMLKELVIHRQSIKDGKTVTIHLEWDIDDEYSAYIACRVLKVEIEKK